MSVANLITLIAVSSVLMAQNVAPPVGLKVVAASKSQVQLSWSPGDASNVTYTVERKTLTGSYAPVLNPTTTSSTDTTILAYQTYNYRVRANLGSAQSAPSNEITVGPAPVGYNVVVPMPSVFTNSDFGREQRIALDANGDPGVAYIVRDVNRDNNYNDSTLYFARWDRVNYAWTKPVTVTVVGTAPRRGVALSLSLAFDASSGMWGVAYEGVSQIGFASSTDNGATWKAQTVFSDSKRITINPMLAMAAGKAYLGFYHDNNGIRYLTGAATAAASTWSNTVAPTLTGSSTAQGSVSLALDSAGNPGLAYWLVPDHGYSSVLAFWRPGSTTAAAILDTANKQNDDPFVTLAFSGAQPRVIAYANRTATFFNSYDQSLWSSTSTTGATWTTPVNLPNDGGNSMDPIASLAVNSKGQSVVIMESNGGSGSAGKCSFPKISLSADSTNWITCAPTAFGSTNFRASYPSIAYDINDMIYFSGTNFRTGDVGSGIIVWRDSFESGSPVPAIANGGIVNAASFATTVAPGSLATIFGSNFSGTAQSASTLPLPLSMGGVSVTVNGYPAPLVYVGSTQINYQVPYEVQPGTANVVVTVNGQSSPASTVRVAAAAPGIFVFGQSRAVVQNANYSVNDVNNPAKVGSTVIAYATGQGLLDNPVPTGLAAPTTVLSRPQGAVTATINGQPATVVFGGLTPGFVGLMQVNLTIPSLSAGTYPLVISVGGASSNAAQITVTP